MFKLNRKIEYALIALKHMNGKRPGELTSAKEVAETYHGSFDVVARVMQVMAQSGILRAEQGALGGYQILKDLSRVSLFELGSVLLGPVKLVKCLDGQDACGIEKTCNIMNPIVSLNQRLDNFYKGVSVLDILSSSDTGSRLNGARSKTEIQAEVRS